MENKLVRRPLKETRINVNAKENVGPYNLKSWTISPISWASMQAQQ